MSPLARHRTTADDRYAPTIPDINLLPEVFQDRDWNRALIRRAIAFLVLAVIVAMGILAFDLGRARGIDRQTDASRQQNTQIVKELRSHADIAKLKATTDSLGGAKSAVNSRNITWSSFLQSLQSTTPVGLSLTQITAATDQGSASTSTTSTGSTQTLPSGAIGTVQVTASSTTLPDVSSWTASVGSIPGVQSVTLLKSERSQQTQSSGTALYETTLTIVLDPTIYAATETEDEQ
jgi:hypothetical protein